jgi:SNF family Na+-dependent transporter
MDIQKGVEEGIEKIKKVLNDTMVTIVLISFTVYILLGLN